MMSHLGFGFSNFFGGQDLQSIVPATKTEPEASEVQHLPRGIIIRFYIKNETISQNETFDPFKTFQNVVQVHQIPRLQGKVTSKTTSQFDPRLANVLATCR